MNADEREDELTLELLQAIEEKHDLTQRHMSDRLGVALGLTNSYLKRCVRKGLIKVKQAPANRYLYYLTPNGFSEKTRLTAKYLSTSLDFYRRAGNSYLDVFKLCQQQGTDKIVMCGISELAEIATIKLKSFNLQLDAYFDPGFDGHEFLGTRILKSVDDIDPEAVCVITALHSGMEMLQLLEDAGDSGSILVPDFLNLDRHAGKTH